MVYTQVCAPNVAQTLCFLFKTALFGRTLKLYTHVRYTIWADMDVRMHRISTNCAAQTRMTHAELSTGASGINAGERYAHTLKARLGNGWQNWQRADWSLYRTSNGYCEQQSTGQQLGCWRSTDASRPRAGGSSRFRFGHPSSFNVRPWNAPGQTGESRLTDRCGQPREQRGLADRPCGDDWGTAAPTSSVVCGGGRDPRIQPRVNRA